MIYRSHRGFNLTPIWVLIGLNLLLFIATAIAPQLRSLFGLHPGDFPIKAWTIVTSLFIHGGIGHILANMITLYFFGRYLCILVGEKKFLIVYFIGGILGNILLLLLAGFFPFSVAYGASGAVFALGGVLAIMRPRLRVFVFPIPAPLPLWAAVIGGFLILSLLPLLRILPIAWQAHLGGLAFGLTIGYFFRKRERLFFQSEP